MSIYSLSTHGLFLPIRDVTRDVIKRLEPWIPSAQPMKSIGEFRWFAVAKIRRVQPGKPDEITRLPGEWHGRTRQQAEARALRAATEWIDARSTE
jgi:hypothetical protein